MESILSVALEVKPRDQRAHDQLNRGICTILVAVAEIRFVQFLGLLSMTDLT